MCLSQPFRFVMGGLRRDKQKRPSQNLCFETGAEKALAVPLKLQPFYRLPLFGLRQALCTDAAFAEDPTLDSGLRLGSDGLQRHSLPIRTNHRLSENGCFSRLRHRLYKLYSVVGSDISTSRTLCQPVSIGINSYQAEIIYCGSRQIGTFLC